MKKEVRVMKVGENYLTLGCDKTACEGCKCSMFCSAKNTEFKVDKPENSAIAEGDRVTIDMPAKKTVFTSFMSLGLPLILFIPGYFIGMHFFSSEGWALICSLAGVGLGFMISGLYFHFSKKKWAPSVVTGGISSEEN